MMNRLILAGVFVFNLVVPMFAVAGDQPASPPPAQQQQIQNLANDIFQKMLIDSKGDPQALMKIISDAQKNPAGFVGGLTSEQQAQFKKITDQMGGNSNPTAAAQAAQKETLPAYPAKVPAQQVPAQQ